MSGGAASSELGPLLVRARDDERAEIVALQHAAYAANRAILGREPLPLQADYDQIFAAHECWVRREDGRIVSALFLEVRPDDLLVWSVASLPGRQGDGLGRAMLAAAEDRARQLGLSTIRLYTGQKLTARVAWYSRHGYMVESVAASGNLMVVHMVKQLG